MEHHGLHPKANFEGYYSKFDLASGSHIALILCSIPNAPTRSHMVSFTYYPASGKSTFQREYFIENIERVTVDEKTKAFELRVPDIGYLRSDKDGLMSYNLKASDGSWSLEAQCHSYTPWRSDKSTPEGWIVHLPLPLHWHVHSLCSPCSFTLSIPSLDSSLSLADQKSHATVHQEKNWANSFPDAHMWVQAWDASSNRGICLAGGKILYNTAFLLGYRSPSLQLDFVPPFSVSYLNLFSPFMSVVQDWETRCFTISVSNYFYKLELRAQAPKEHGWFGLASPFPDGHRHNTCCESFIATLHVRVFERRGWMPWSGWNLIKTEKFENASLEFAGEFYSDRGERKEE